MGPYEQQMNALGNELGDMLNHNVQQGELENPNSQDWAVVLANTLSALGRQVDTNVQALKS